MGRCAVCDHKTWSKSLYVKQTNIRVQCKQINYYVLTYLLQSRNFTRNDRQALTGNTRLTSVTGPLGNKKYVGGLGSRLCLCCPTYQTAQSPFCITSKSPTVPNQPTAPALGVLSNFPQKEPFRSTPNPFLLVFDDSLISMIF
jgi:hypothetical protein